MHTLGGVVGPGEVLLEIVPVNDQLIVESRVRPEDVDRVRPGLEAAVKLLAFESAVNVTLGLPIVRTSPDHGTAWDIAGKGIADPGSMIAASLLAAKLAGGHPR